MIPLLGVSSKNPKPPISRNTGAPTFIAVLFAITKICKQLKGPLEHEWIKKTWYIFTMEYDVAVKRMELLDFAIAWMELKIITLREISQ